MTVIQGTSDDAKALRHHQAERVNSLLKDNHGGRHVRVRGVPKVFTHWMFGILVIAAEQRLRLLNEPSCRSAKGSTPSGGGSLWPENRINLCCYSGIGQSRH